jgi:serine/threonine-protein kinase
MDSDSRFAVGSVLAGKLRIVRPLGAGGMGAVYEVEHELTHHRRALKLLHPQMAQIPSVVERFLREASAAGRIGNSHIVETFDAGRLDTGEPYIVMELLQGKTLAEVLDERGPLPLETACDIVMQACDAVAAAHAAGIVHRDLKPENLFLSGPALGFVKILDFGVSKFDSVATGVEGLTLEGSPIGTPYYMSPEQVRGEKSIDARADVYALGVLFYECLTGRKPFVAETLPHLAVLIHQGNYSLPSGLRPGLPKAADSVVSRAMASDRAERYGSAAEFASGIARLRDSLQPGVLGETQPLLPTEPRAAGPAPALTPAVFTKPSAPAPNPRAPKGWIAAVLAVVVVSAIGGSLLLGKTSAPPAAAESAAAPTPPKATAPAAEPVPEATTAPATSAAAKAPSVVPEPAPGPAGSAGKAVVVRPGASAAPASSSRSRASSYGLAEDNPFK